jgi:hypothetical protein
MVMYQSCTLVAGKDATKPSQIEITCVNILYPTYNDMLCTELVDVNSI